MSQLQTIRNGRHWTTVSKKKIHPLIKFLIARRLYRGISRVKLSQAIGCADDSIGDWERGEHTPRMDNLVAWCQALGVRLTAKDINNGG